MEYNYISHAFSRCQYLTWSLCSIIAFLGDNSVVAVWPARPFLSMWRVWLTRLTHSHTHTPESLFLYPKHHTNYHPHQNKRVPHPEREKDNGIVPCNDVVCSQREQQRKHQKAAAHHKVTEERTYKGTCPYSLQTITFGCCGHILFLQQLEEALLVPSFSPGVESVDEFFEVHDVLQRHLCLNIRA